MKPSALMIAALLLASVPAWASGDGDKKDEAGGAPAVEASVGQRGVVMKPAAAFHDPIAGVRVNITQFSYPGVPERAACRTVIRTENDSPYKISFYTLVRTFDREKAPLGTWMTPSGDLPPGQAGERLYSCKLARYVVLDQGSAEGWPNACRIDDEDRSPCPIQLVLNVNIDPLPVPEKDKKAKGDGQDKPTAKH